jgi:hypothetical protein
MVQITILLIIRKRDKIHKNILYLKSKAILIQEHKRTMAGINITHSWATKIFIFHDKLADINNVKYTVVLNV